MLKSYSLQGNIVFYYDLDRKTIARKPTQSNLKEIGSDNSLYFGMVDNDEIVDIFLELFDKQNIEDINGTTFSMTIANTFADVDFNINREGQMQIKIKKDGKMLSLLEIYSDYTHQSFDREDLLIVLDFSNMTISFRKQSSLIL